MRTRLDESTARRLAVRAECDPRTVRRVLSDLAEGRSEKINTLSAKRALAALVAEGIVPQTKAA